MQNNIVLVVSYNQPKFSATALWIPSGITFATDETVGSHPYGIFVNTNNTVFASNKQNGRIVVWFERDITSPETISDNFLHPLSLFVTVADDIYVDNGYVNNRIDKWTSNTRISAPAMHIDGPCYGLAVDINDRLYCSMADRHQVVTKSLNGGSKALTIIAGTGCPGSTSNMLYFPHGIFVDISLDLYVADCTNDRIQLFHHGKLNGVTKAGDGAPETIPLDCPTAVVLDGNKHLFIVDSNNHRIVGERPSGFQCLVGCSYSEYNDLNELMNPQSMAFDSYGNIFVTDQSNHRVQKFILANNTLGKLGVVAIMTIGPSVICTSVL